MSYGFHFLLHLGIRKVSQKLACNVKIKFKMADAVNVKIDHPIVWGKCFLVFVLLKRMVSPNDWGGQWGQSHCWPPAGFAIMPTVVDKIAPSAHHIITQYHFGQRKKYIV